MRGMTRHERLATEERDLRFYTNLGLLIAVGIGASVAVFHGGVFTAALAAYGSAVGLGGVLGFLFGIPSAAKAPVTIKADTVAVGAGQGTTVVGGNVSANPAPPASDPAAIQLPEGENQLPEDNAASASQTASSSVAPLASASPAVGALPPAATPSTSTSTTPAVSNLEQVADWVTKLLLGGGLTQMQRIPPKVWQWSRVVALGVLRDNPGAKEQLIVAQQAFAAGLLVYGFVVGFFGGFLITKLQLGKAISSSGA